MPLVKLFRTLLPCQLIPRQLQLCNHTVRRYLRHTARWLVVLISLQMRTQVFINWSFAYVQQLFADLEIRYGFYG